MEGCYAVVIKITDAGSASGWQLAVTWRRDSIGPSTRRTSCLFKGILLLRILNVLQYRACETVRIMRRFRMNTYVITQKHKTAFKAQR
jgi:hypothetical protein